MANHSLKIRKPETLATRLEAMEVRTLEKAQASHTTERVQTTLRINGSEVSFTVTPFKAQPGRYYRLFHIDGKRTPKECVPQRLLPSDSSAS